MSDYLPLCDYSRLKFGGEKEKWTKGYQNLCLGSSAAFIALSPEGKEVLYSIIGFLAMIGPLAVERCAPPILRARKVGLQHGGVLLRAAQVAGFAVPLTTGLVMHFMEVSQDSENIGLDTSIKPVFEVVELENVPNDLDTPEIVFSPEN